MIIMNVEKKLGDVLIKCDFKLDSNGITAVYGASGAGKTSIINMMAGLISPDSGIISFRDKEFFEYIAANKNSILKRSKAIMEYIIAVSCRLKAEIVEQDEKESGIRKLLNFGHTLGHAIEQYYHYEHYSHGEAVSIGMYQLTRLSENQHLTDDHVSDQIRDILVKYGLPYHCDVATKDLLQAIALDKKNINNSLSLVLLKNIGNSYVYQCDQTFLLKQERV